MNIIMGKIGFVSISHVDYLDDIVFEQTAQAEACIKKTGFELVSVGKQITNYQSAQEAGKYLVSQNIDGVVFFLASWLECPVMMAVLRNLEHLPLCVWGFPMCLMNGQFESTGSYVSFAMIKGTLDRIEYPYTAILDTPDSENVQHQLDTFCYAATCAAKLKSSMVGLVGYTSMSIYPGTFDHVFMRVKIGPEIEHYDAYTLINMAETYSEEQRDRVIEQYQQHASIGDDVTTVSLRKSAGIYLALEKLASERNMAAVNIKCQYEFSKEYKMVPCVPLSLLAETGVVASCEGDMLNTISMLILHYLTGQTVTYGDTMNHIGNTVKFSSCGFLPFSLGEEGKQRISNFMPHPGFTGIQNRFVLRPGRVTIMRLIEDRCDYHILYFTGEGMPTELRQNYMPALDVKIDGKIEDLLTMYSGQHYAICYGDVSDKIEVLAKILKIKAIHV